MRASRYWRTPLGRLWLPMEHRHEYEQDREAQADRPHAPKCVQCSKELGRRVGVVGVEVKSFGKRSGDPYTDIRFLCHGVEEVITFAGMNWEKHSGSPSFAEKMRCFPAFAGTGESKVNWRRLTMTDARAEEAARDAARLIPPDDGEATGTAAVTVH